MKKACLALIPALLWAGAAQAAALWEGIVIVTAVEGCPFGVGFLQRAGFAPRNVAGNSGDTRLTLANAGGIGGAAYNIFEGDFAGKGDFSQVTYISGSAVFGGGTVIPPTESFRRAKTKPAVITENTSTFSLQVTINNFLFNNGCTATLLGNFVKVQ